MLAPMLHDSVYQHFLALPQFVQNITVGLLWGLIAWVFMKIVRGYLLHRVQNLKHVDDTLDVFLSRVVQALGWVLIVIAVLLGVGVPASALGGLVAAGGFVVGFAMKDTLGNMAAGAVLLMNRPYNVGESVRIKGEDGVVEALGVSMTTLRTWDGRMVMVPNGTVLGDAILNHTRNPTRRVEVAVGIGYDDDVDKALRAAMEAVNGHPEVRSDPAPMVLVSGLGESSVDLKVRAWVDTPDFGRMGSELTAKVKRAIEGSGCSIPFPQRDLHIVSGSPLATE